VGIGDRLREERDRLGLTQTDFAELVGASKNTQSNYEKEVRKPDSDYLLRLSDAGADTIYVLTGQRASSQMTGPESELIRLFRLSGESTKAALIALLKTFSDSPRNEAGDQPKAAIGSVVGQANVGQVTNTSHKMKFGN
jgi:transcriptional regulator with XRE-family HTH domain